MRQNMRYGLAAFIVISVLIHFSAWIGLRFSKTPDFLSQKEQIEIVVLDQRPEGQKMQIVEQSEKALNDEIPEEAKYLSAHNQRVVKETAAQQVGDFRNSAGRGETQLPSQNAQPPKSAKSKVAKAQGTLPTLADLSPRFDPSTSRKVETQTGSGGPASQTNDHLKDTPSSLETMLNTREFVYYTYYQRIRSQIRQYWEPSIRSKVKKIFATGRSIASEKDHITRVIIILDNSGNLMRVQVVGESGVKDLDDAAVEAFRAAEPFPNPPKGIVDADGTIKINWDFILEA